MIIKRTASLLRFRATAQITYNQNITMDGISLVARLLVRDEGWAWDGSIWFTNNYFTYYRLCRLLEAEAHFLEYQILDTPIELPHRALLFDKAHKSNKTLRPDQIAEINRLNSYDFAICGDECGTGKMVVGSKLAETYLLPTIIAVPNDILWEWYDHLTEWLNEGKEIEVLDARYFNQSDFSTEYSDGINLIPFSMLNKASYEMESPGDFNLIVDEVHKMSRSGNANKKGPMKAEGLRRLSQEAVDIKLFSGTIFLNSPADLVGELYNLNLGYITKNLGSFRNEILGQELIKQKVGWNKEITTLSACSEDELYIDRMRGFLASINYSRKLRCELFDIPAKLRQTVAVCNLNKSRKVLEASAGDDIESTNYFTMCRTSALRKVKNQEFRKWLLTKKDASIMFYYHTEVLDSVCELLRTNGTTYTTIDGDIGNAQEIKDRVDSFQNGEKEVILISLKKTEGLTLTRAKCEIFLELPFTIGSILQAEDRMFRFGLDHPGTVYYPVDYKGPEARKLEILAQKASYTKAMENDNTEILSEVL